LTARPDRQGVAAPRGASAAPAAWLVLLVPATLVALQLVVWLALATRFEGSIDNDVAEGVVDGPAWRLSYLRHPPLSSWLSGLAANAGDWRYVALFGVALAFACGAFVIAAGFVARVDRRGGALVTLLAGLASPYATYWPLKFNHNIGVMPFWAIVLWTAWSAFEGGSLVEWAAFGAAVGFGLWAKYAILHLALPLAAACLVVPEWRKRLATPGPWVAVAIAVAIIAPQAVDVASHGATPLKWAVHQTRANALQRVGWIVMFVFDCALANLSMASLAWAACGRARLVAALRAAFARETRTRLDLFLHVAIFGPIVVIVLFAPFGVRLFYHWLTPLTVGFAAWWGHLAARAGFSAPRRLWLVFALWAAALAGGYVGVREVWRLQTPLSNGAYPEMDGPGLARLAEDYWAAHAAGPIPYIVSLDGKVSFQAAGSIAFDLPYRALVLKDGESLNAPWLDVADLRRRGALVVCDTPTPDEKIDGASTAVRDLTGFTRPTLSGVRAPPKIYFGVIDPGS
jgi:hypothetical protein